MSIIYEALKQAEGVNNKTETQPAKKAKNLPIIYLISGVVAVTGIFMANILFGVFTKPAQTNTAVSALKAPVVTQGAVKQAVVLPQTKPPASLPSLVLSGIFFSEDQGYALINNRIVKEGDLIDGAVLVRVSLNEVELKSQDSDTTIKLSLSNN